MQSLVVNLLSLLSIFIPLTFTFINSELFEFPKFILLLSGSLVLLGVWLVDLLYFHHRPKFRLNLLHFSVLAVLATQLLATAFSISPYTSFWGYYSRFHGGLLTTICYTLIYFSALNWLDKKSTLKIIKISVITSFLVGLYAVAEHFGIDKNLWVQDVQNRVFSTLGQPNWLAAYLLPNLALALYLLVSKELNAKFLFAIIPTLFISLLFTRSRSGILAFGLGYLTFWAVASYHLGYTHIKQYFVSTTIYTALIAILLGTPYTPSLSSLVVRARTSASTAQVAQGTVLENGGTESGDIRKIVWTGALDLIKKYPLLGTGPETFAYSYYWTRPSSHNQTSEWDFLYNKAHNEYLNVGAGAGLLGLVAYLYFHFMIFVSGLAKSSKRTDPWMSAVLSSSVVGFFVTNFFGFSVIPVYLMMILVASFGSTIHIDKVETKSLHNPYLFLAILLPLIYPGRLFIADISYARGKAQLDQGHAQSAIPYLQDAVAIRPGLDLYRSGLGEAYALSGQTDLALSQLEINKSLNPYHLNFYKSRAKIYLTLAQSHDPAHYYDLAAKELELGRVLAPTDPKLSYNLALIYTRLDDADNAEKNLKETIRLKPNYQEPYYALTLLYEQTKKTDQISAVLDQAQANLATYSAQLKEKMEKY